MTMFWNKQRACDTADMLAANHRKCPGCGRLFHEVLWRIAVFCTPECESENLTTALAGEGRLAEIARGEICRLREVISNLQQEISSKEKTK